METDTLELEGTWEEILAWSSKLSGRRIQQKAFPAASSPSARTSIRPENRATLEVLKEWREDPLSEEDRKILEEFEQFRKDHPIRFRVLEDES